MSESSSRIQQLNDELLILRKQVERIQSEMTAKISELYTKMEPLQSELKSLLPPDPELLKYILDSIASLKKISADIDEDAIKSQMLTHLKELPNWIERKEDGKYYDPSWRVNELQYKWGDESIEYEQWSLWLYPKDTPVYSNTKDDAEYIESICRNIIESLSSEEFNESFNKLGYKYIPILTAYINKDFDC